jgi:hypothetical protein
MEREIVNSRIICADITIKPDVDDINPASFEQSELCVQRGREVTEDAMPEIIKLIRMKN